jgi:hypothetical protein
VPAQYKVQVCPTPDNCPHCGSGVYVAEQFVGGRFWVECPKRGCQSPRAMDRVSVITAYNTYCRKHSEMQDKLNDFRCHLEDYTDHQRTSDNPYQEMLDAFNKLFPKEV